MSDMLSNKNLPKRKTCYMIVTQAFLTELYSIVETRLFDLTETLYWSDLFLVYHLWTLAVYFSIEHIMPSEEDRMCQIFLLILTELLEFLLHSLQWSVNRVVTISVLLVIWLEESLQNGTELSLKSALTCHIPVHKLVHKFYNVHGPMDVPTLVFIR